MDGLRQRRKTLGYWNKAMLDDIMERVALIRGLVEKLQYTIDPAKRADLNAEIYKAIADIYKSRSEITIEQPTARAAHTNLAEILAELGQMAQQERGEDQKRGGDPN